MSPWQEVEVEEEEEDVDAPINKDRRKRLVRAHVTREGTWAWAVVSEETFQVCFLDGVDHATLTAQVTLFCHGATYVQGLGL